MKFKRKPVPEQEASAGKSPQQRGHPAFRHALCGQGIAGFTLAEVLAALVFMAILIPVALEGLSIASRAGEVAVRKSEAALVAERILNESVVTTNWNSAVQNGTLRQGLREFRYSSRSDPWVQDPNQSAMRQLLVEVFFTAQGRDYSVKMSTLVDSTSAFSQTQQQQQTSTGQ